MVTDEEIIARASGGLALCRAYVGKTDARIGRVQPVKELLRLPEKCKLMDSDQMYQVWSHSCSNIQASERFRKEVKNSGWTAAMDFHVNVCGFNFEVLEGGGLIQNKQMSLSSQEMTKEACHMQIWYIPKASFAIPLDEMQLSEKALDDARQVQTLSDADKFLSDYDSHVSTDKYHVGGVLMRGLVMRSRTTTSLQQMLEKVSKNANLAGGIDFERFKVSETVGFTDESSSSTEHRASHQAAVEYFHSALGPKTDEEADFKAQLEDKSTWDIIDRIDGPGLVPVWEIPLVKHAKNMQICCSLLREAWQNYVKRVAAERKAIPLISSVQALLRNEIEPLLPLEDMSLGALVDRLKTLLGRSSSGTSVTITAFESNAVAKAIRDFFRHNQNDGNLVGEVRRLIPIHGFDENGEIRQMTRVTREEMNILVHELESVTGGFQPSTSTDQHEVADILAGPVTAEGCYLQISDMLERNSHVLDLETSSKTRTKGFISLGAKRPQVQFSFSELCGGGFECECVDSGQVPCKIHADGKTFRAKKTGSIYIVHGRHMLVDRPRDASDDPLRRMVDRIRHRLDLFESTSSNPANVSKRKTFFAGPTGVNKGMSGNEIARSHSTSKSSPLANLVQLLTNSDLLAQTALLQLLLDARIAIPLVVPLHTRAAENSSFGHLAEALDFVRVKLAKQEILSISEDTKLPRVVFLSNRKSLSKRETSLMASKVMNFQLPSKFSKGDTADGSPIIELGVGFLNVSEGESRDYKPCLVFCVWGDHNCMGKFLAKVADFLIVELDPSEEASTLSWNTGDSKDQILYWKINPSDEGYESEPYVTFWGSFQQIADEIEIYLLEGIVEQKLFKGASEDGAATLEQCLTSIPPFKEKTPVFNLANLDGVQIEKAKESLQLQKNFVEEAGFYFKSLRQKSAKAEYVSKMLKLQNERKKRAPGILELPLLKTFISILSLKNYVERNIGIVNFEMNIEQKLHVILERAYEKEAQAFKESQQNEDDLQLKDKHMLARREHMDKKLGLEHLWRELSHIFVANTGLKYLPQRAAEHLIDGFPLEILDGDASMFNSLWVESVLSEIDTVLSASLKHKPKVFVLSVIGLQSSGKSTLLNLMFGTKLKTSAGQCTRGVYLQLIKSERKEFDYVLILDTEGLRSPEFFSEKNFEIHDNRLATFAVLPTDACIVMVANEEDGGLKEVLPMVMLAFKGSAMGAECAGRRQAQVFFAYRSVDTSESENLGSNQRKLQEDLRSASKHVGGVSTLLRDFRVSRNEEESDVKYFGNLKMGNIPLGGIPDWDYGTRVERLREYIHKRVTDDGFWQGYELKSWATQLKLVWNCISEANFEISFRNQIEYLQFHLLQEKLVACRKKLGKKWMEEFEKLDGDLQVRRGTVEGLQVQAFQPLLNKLRLTVQKILDESAKEVKTILEQPQWQKWKDAELVNWDKFCSKQDRDWPQRLQDSFDTVFKFENVVKDYNARIQMEIDSEAKRRICDTTPYREKIMKSVFNEILQRILREVQNAYPPTAETVPSKVISVYQGAITGLKFEFSKDEATTDQCSDFSTELSVSNSHRVKASNSFKRFMRKLNSIEKKEKKDSIPNDRIQKMISVLESTLKAHLQDAKQYADHYVEEMISFTEKLIEEAKVSRREQEAIHRHVKRLLTEKLGTIQEKWDKNHNVSKWLEEEEIRLWVFFQNCANRVAGTKLLSTQIDIILKSKLMDVFRSSLSKHVSNKLSSDAWAGNWIVMTAHLDLHLVELIEASHINELLRCVRNGADHYKIVVDNLIKQEIMRQLNDDRLWVSFLEAIQQAVRNAARCASDSESGSPKSSEFAKNFVESLNDISAGSQELTRNIFNYLSEGLHQNFDKDIDFDKLANDVCQGLDSSEPDLKSSSIEKVVKLVTQRMIRGGTENVGPRCTEMCPCCTVTCFRCTNHSGLHDTLHQPAGLCGVYNEDTQELQAFSCSESVALEHVFEDETIEVIESTSFKDWNTHYPEWRLPTKGSLGTVDVREYIFARYQKELVDISNQSSPQRTHKICSKIPPEFLLHEIGALRCQLQNIIAPT